MKLNPTNPLTQQQISEYIEMNKEFEEEFQRTGVGIEIAIPPNPPTAEAVKKAQFVDKTYQWKQKS